MLTCTNCQVKFVFLNYRELAMGPIVEYTVDSLVISTSFISNNRLSRSESLVPVLKWNSNNSWQNIVKRGETAPKKQFLLFSTIFGKEETAPKKQFLLFSTIFSISYLCNSLSRRDNNKTPDKQADMGNHCASNHCTTAWFEFWTPTLPTI